MFCLNEVFVCMRVEVCVSACACVRVTDVNGESSTSLYLLLIDFLFPHLKFALVQ